MVAPFSKYNALYFIILLGFVSLFADITYEGARSISGQYLGLLGATGALVAFVAAFGELIGYGFRLISGIISDRTGRYWLITIFGYTLNLIAVPLLAFAGNLEIAVTLMFLERFGKALRTPARDAMLSFATKEMGRGFGFGLHEALDQVGAILGPLLVSCILYFKGTYSLSFLLLAIPAFAAIIILLLARNLNPNPKELEIEILEIKPKGFKKEFWIYIGAISFVAAGFIDFPLIAFHFDKVKSVPLVWIPLFYSLAMAADGISALIFGKYYDKKGIKVLIYIVALTSIFVPLVFLGGFYLAMLGMILWGIGLGAQESIMRAALADLVQKDLRGTAYGLLNVCFGFSWFLGSVIIGLLYDYSIPYLLAFSLGMQLLSIPVFLLIKK